MYTGKLKFKEEYDCDVVCRRKINDHLKGNDKAQSYSQKLPIHQRVFSIFIPKCFISDNKKSHDKKNDHKRRKSNSADSYNFSSLLWLTIFPSTAKLYNSQDTPEKQDNTIIQNTIKIIFKSWNKRKIYIFASFHCKTDIFRFLAL